jgi:hypothetical protein
MRPRGLYRGQGAHRALHAREQAKAGLDERPVWVGGFEAFGKSCSERTQGQAGVSLGRLLYPVVLKDVASPGGDARLSRQPSL